METHSGAGNLSSIRTAVFYRWNAYLPENASDLKSCYEIFFKDYSSTEVFYLSNDSSTDYLDFVEYDFKLKPEKENYKNIVKGNLFDSETKDLCKESGIYNYNSLNWLSNYMVPQYRQELGDSIKKEFWGLITKDSETFIYLDIPGEERDLDLIKKPGIWKVELYSEILNSNNSFSSSFIEYSVLEKCGQENTSIKPNLVITFGPPINAKQNYLEEYNKLNNSNNSYRFFYNSFDLKGYVPKYPVPIEQENIDGWIDLCREISSNKLLSIIITSDNNLSGVNLSQISWEKSNNPNRNQNKYSLRNDQFWATRETVKSMNNKDKNLGDFIYDSTSGTLLGTKKLYQGSTPGLERRLRALDKKFYSRKVYKAGEIVAVNDSLYISLISGNLGENPMYSNYWKYLRKYSGESDEKYLSGVSKETLDILKTQLSPKHSSFYIHTNNKTFSDIYPIGEVSYKEGVSKTLKIKPRPGYILSEVIVNGVLYSEINYNQSEDCYEYLLISSSEKVGKVEDIFIKVEKTIPSIVLVSPLKIQPKSGKEEYYYFKDAHSLMSNLGIDVKFYIDDYISGEVLNEGQEEELKKKYLLYKDYKKIYFKINDEFSRHQFKALINQKTNTNFPKLTTEGLSPYDTVILVSSNEEDHFTSKDILIVLEDKLLEVSVNTDSLIDSSSVGDYVVYGDSLSISFTTNIELSQFDRLEYTFLGSSNPIIIPNVGSYDEFGNLGNYGDDRLVSRLVNNQGIYTYTLYNIKKNCKIEIFGKSL